VSSQFDSTGKVLGGNINIQSKTYGCEYLESRINLFLDSLPAFSEEQVSDVVQAQIKNHM